MTTANELRELYLSYFEKECGHRRVASSPIVPPDDPTMLFTTAGMVQFKPFYSGQVSPLPYTRATTCQKCLRAGGKASDLENVGKTARHHTFFEMLGNFSFGDYFKREALQWGWKFIWDYLKLPKERLWATIYEDDDEAEQMLEKEIGIPLSRIIRLDAKENFWGPAGETGACGPCSEICFFMGSEHELQKAMTQDRETIAKRIVEEGDLFLEIWNMVFPQFDQQLDGSRPPLKNKGIDTGAGLERMTTVMQFMESGGKIRTPYQTDLIWPITKAAAEILGVAYENNEGLCEADRDPHRRYWTNAAADHARALTFALSEGIVPSNEGRGYVLRRILRRASRFGFLLGKEEPFLYKLVEPVIQVMGDTYPDIKARPDHVAEIIRIEEERFVRTVAQGSKILDDMIDQLKNSSKKALAGSDAFLLHATYGFPVDMTAEILEENELELDRPGYAEAMKGHQEEAKKSWKGTTGGREAELVDDVYNECGETDFVGYRTQSCDARVLALVQNDARVESLTEGQEGVVALEETPFYAEMGGQVGDTGVLEFNGSRFEVTDTTKTPNGIYLHRGRMVKGSLAMKGTVRAQVNQTRRISIMRHHTVTHLLQAALKQVIGSHVTQAGSFVGADGMRFDFAHTQACTQEQLNQVERIVNEMILEDSLVFVEEMLIEDARKRGAIAPFGEKYGHKVRVVQIGGEQGAHISHEDVVSMEFCGGTHLDRVGHIGSFRIVAEASVAAGIRRIEGVAGLPAYAAWAETRNVAASLCRSMAVKENQLAERVQALQDEIKNLQKELKKAKSAPRSGAASPDALLATAKEINGVKVVFAKVEGADSDMLRQLVDQLRDKAGANFACVLGAVQEDKVLLVCGVTKDLTKKVQAGNVIKLVAPIVGGGGGGRPDFAQAGGKDPSKLDDAIAQAPDIIGGMLK